MANWNSDSKPIISVQQVSHSFWAGKVEMKALQEVSLKIEAGKLFGLIGPDGAGKTTLFRILTTLLVPKHGTATVLGYDVVKSYRSIRPMLGYMPGKFSLYGDLTVEENLSFFASLFNTNMEANRHLINDIYIQLEPFRHRRAAALSGGMKQKLALCCALIHEPQILFLDEPTTGVDAVSRREFWDMLQRLRASGLTIMVSTPYMDEAARCDEVALIQHGRILSTNTPEQIRASYPNGLFAVRSKQMLPLLAHLRKAPFALRAYPFGEWHHLAVRPSTITLQELRQYVQDEFSHAEVQACEADIEDCFIELMHNPI